MYHFKKMIEQARIDGVYINNMDNNLEKSEEAERDFFDAVNECQPIVFGSQGKLMDLTQYPHDYHRDFDGPFKTFSIEKMGTNNTLAVSKDRRFGVMCVVCAEKSPRIYQTFVMYSNPFVVNGWKSAVVKIDLTNICSEYIDRLNNEELGVIKLKERIKIGKSKDKKVLDIRRLVVCCPKKDKIERVDGREVDWSHRWRVRGHWMRIEEGSIGKDRAGDYCIHGMTWRSEHVKGPEHMKIVDKVRLIK